MTLVFGFAYLIFTVVVITAAVYIYFKNRLYCPYCRRRRHYEHHRRHHR